MNYQNLYNELISKAQSQIRFKKNGVYYERHHITPKSLGGDDAEKNLVLLTAKEHYVAHHLLWKIHQTSLTAFAFKNMRMSRKYQKRIVKPITAKEYNKLKSKTREILVDNGKKVLLKLTPEELKDRGMKQLISGQTRQASQAQKEIAEQRHINKLIELNLPIEFKPTIEEAKNFGLNRFYGRVCDKHPELGGKRLLSNKNCYTCHSERRNKWYKNTKQQG